MPNRTYEQLTLADDFIFCKVFQHNPDLCKKLLERILGHPLGDLIEIEQQETIRITSDRKGVRFDVYAKDDQSVVYDVEMQNANRGDLPRRVRYAQSLMDLEQLERGEKYRELTKSYVIYICNFQLFPVYNRSRYIFRNLCVDDTRIELDDGTEKIFLCTEGSDQNTPGELRDFLNYISGKEATDDFTNELDYAVRVARQNATWRKEYMTLQDYIDDAILEARKSEEKARKSEEKARRGEEKARRNEEKARKSEEKARKSAEKEKELRLSAEAKIIQLEAQLAALRSKEP